ncbi:MAG: uracil-DNA glycosylase [Alphaproteobacteria bacterium]|nr:uracil-DNA glycosylase [Alphaproteobacteria bacterium]
MGHAVTKPQTRQDALAMLQWYADTGVDEAIDNDAVNFFSLPQHTNKAKTNPPAAPTKKPTAPPPLTPAATRTPRAPTSLSVPTKATALLIEEAQQIAAECATLDALKTALENFEGCPLKKLASTTVFGQGNPHAAIMFVGEAPNEDDDNQGAPFSGESGKLFDKMLAAIALDRHDSAYLSSIVYWRPPGNRAPNSEELETCRPFVQKHIALVQPKILVMVGGVSASSLLASPSGISRLRGKSYQYTNAYLDKPIESYAIFHPSYLMQQPAHKAHAWKDLITIKQSLKKKT